MKLNQFGNTDLKISELCLGTMTFGTRTGADEAHAQIDMAVDHGINIIDTAELYPVTPISKETQGESEKIVGQWIQKSGRRADILIATKVAGPGISHIRNGAPINRSSIMHAVERSLRYLRTDCIDLYQLHWPNRASYTFRRNWTFDPTSQKLERILDHMTEVLETLQELVDAGEDPLCRAVEREFVGNGAMAEGFGRKKPAACSDHSKRVQPALPAVRHGSVRACA